MSTIMPSPRPIMDDQERCSQWARRAGAFSGQRDALLWGIKDALRYIDTDPAITKMLLESILRAVEHVMSAEEQP